MSTERYERQKARQRERYRTDPEYREYHRRKHKEWYQNLKNDPVMYK